MRRIDLTGKQFGDLTITTLYGSSWTSASGKKTVQWEALCKCGKVVICRSNNLSSGNTTSCGSCGRKRSHFIHGGRGTSEYASYCTAYQRCNNPKNARYYRYGARGIEFRFTRFQDFIEELGPRPQGYVLDRIDNDGHYERGNLKWSTKSESIRNSSKCLGVIPKRIRKFGA